MNKPQKEFYRQFSQHGTADAQVKITPAEVALMLFIAYKDLHGRYPDESYASICHLADVGFYRISFAKIKKMHPLTEDECFSLLDACGATNINGML